MALSAQVMERLEGMSLQELADLAGRSSHLAGGGTLTAEIAEEARRIYKEKFERKIFGDEEQA